LAFFREDSHGVEEEIPDEDSHNQEEEDSEHEYVSVC